MEEIKNERMSRRNLKVTDIETIRIKNVELAALQLLKKKYKPAIIIVGLFLSIIGFIEIKAGVGEWSIVLLGCFVGFIFGIFFLEREKIFPEFIKQFAQAMGLTYSTEGNMNTVAGPLFTSGDSQEIKYVAGGYFNNFPMRLFTFFFVADIGDDKGERVMTVLEITFETDLPTIVFRRISLESESEIFHFTYPLETYIPLEEKGVYLSTIKGYEVEALQIFKPEFIKELLNMPLALNLVLHSNKLYIYYVGRVLTLDKLIVFYNFAEKTAFALGPFLKRLHRDIDALEPYFPVKK